METPEPYVTAPVKRKLSDDCWKTLDCLRMHSWRATSLDLARVNMLNYRARVSDLRRFFGVDIVAESQRDQVTRKLHTVYVVPEQHQARAIYLWQNHTVDGFVSKHCQIGLFVKGEVE
ncbi:MAG: hypothetical protein WC683_06950 [bacterium]